MPHLQEKPPTAPVTELFDPLEHKPPKGVVLLVITEGNVLIKSQWFDGARAWGFLPQIPMSVKLRYETTKP